MPKKNPYTFRFSSAEGLKRGLDAALNANKKPTAKELGLADFITSDGRRQRLKKVLTKGPKPPDPARKGRRTKSLAQEEQDSFDAIKKLAVELIITGRKAKNKK